MEKLEMNPNFWKSICDIPKTNSDFLTKKLARLIMNENSRAFISPGSVMGRVTPRVGAPLCSLLKIVIKIPEMNPNA